jgi:hypothetical protein
VATKKKKKVAKKAAPRRKVSPARRVTPKPKSKKPVSRSPKRATRTGGKVATLAKPVRARTSAIEKKKKPSSPKRASRTAAKGRAETKSERPSAKPARARSSAIKAAPWTAKPKKGGTKRSVESERAIAAANARADKFVAEAERAIAKAERREKKANAIIETSKGKLSTKRPTGEKKKGESAKKFGTRVARENFWYYRKYLTFVRVAKRKGIDKEAARDLWSAFRPRDAEAIRLFRLEALQTLQTKGGQAEGGQRVLESLIMQRDARYLDYVDLTMALGFTKRQAKDYWFSPKVKG